MKSGITMDIPPEAGHIINSLNRAGYEAYVVGGCVRDRLLGKQPKDWDISTSAKPSEVKRLFAKTADTGVEHGTVTVVSNLMNYEVTTFRIDGCYSDYRRPSGIRFASSMEADLSRRDFTVNAIAYHPEKGFCDPFGGRRDLEKGVIRAVGNPDERFREDALRMLRAIRFSARLGFAIEPETLRAIRENSPLAANISRERVRDELAGILTSGDPVKFLMLVELGLMRHVLPELEDIFGKAAGTDLRDSPPEKIFEAMKRTCPDKAVRWAVLLYYSANAAFPSSREVFARDMMKRLRYDNKTASLVSRLVKFRPIFPGPDYIQVRKTLKETGKDVFSLLLEMKKASPEGYDPEVLAKILNETDRINSIYDDIVKKGQCTSLHELALRGRDLTDSGFKPGKEIGIILDKLLDAVIENPELNEKEKLLELARTYS